LLPAGTNLGVDQRSLTASPAAIRQLSPPVQHAVIESLSRSIHVTFLFAVPLVVLAFFVTFLLKETPLRTTAHLTVDTEAGVGASAA
jgi:hypothetical protein